MPLESKKSRVTLFFVIGFGLSLLMALLKAVLAWVTHTYLYSVPWIGGFLRSIELAEISNLLVFAILGLGIGGATFLLPHRWDHRIKLAFLLFVSPFVFSASYMMQQHLWIKSVAAQSNLAYRDARTLTNDYLERAQGSRGFFGFYPFSTQLAELPTRQETLLAEQALNPNEQLSKELASYDDPRADLAAYWFERVGWLIRFMYMTIAALTGLIYYFKGYAWAENRGHTNSRAATPQPAPSPKTIKPKPRKHQTSNRQKTNEQALNNQATRNKPQSTAAYPELYHNDPLTKPSDSPKPHQRASRAAKSQNPNKTSPNKASLNKTNPNETNPDTNSQTNGQRPPDTSAS